MISIKNILLIALIAITSVNKSISCTEIMLGFKKEYVVGRNFDWPINYKYAFLVINPKGIQRQSNTNDKQTKSLTWTAKYGSITVDLAKDKNTALSKAVMSGMNDQGLTASALWLEKSSFPVTPTKPILTTGLWVQYFLDNARTVHEAIQLANEINIEPTIFNGKKILLHVILHDAAGNSTVMDFINGKLHITRGKNLSVLALTNDSYQESVNELKKYQDFGGKLPLPGGYESKERFVRAASFIKNTPKSSSLQQTISDVFAGLANTADLGTDSPTVWSIVFDLTHKIVYYRDIDNKNIRSVHLLNFNLKQNKSVKILMLNNNLNGNLDSQFQPAIFSQHDSYLLVR